MSATRGRLLVVDDDLVQRVLISKIGSKLGYDSVVVPSYEAAIELLAREAFDIMALDLSLGERDGVRDGEAKLEATDAEGTARLGDRGS